MKYSNITIRIMAMLLSSIASLGRAIPAQNKKAKAVNADLKRLTCLFLAALVFVTVLTGHTVAMNPVIVGEVATPGYAGDVHVSGPYAFIANTYAGYGYGYGGALQVVDISQPEDPALVASVSIQEWATDVYVTGNYAYLTINGGTYNPGKLYIIDVSTPWQPVMVGYVSLPGDATSVYVSNSYAYVNTVDPRRFQVVDISNPRSPVVLGSLDMRSSPLDVHVLGPYVHVAVYGYLDNKGFQVIDVSDPRYPWSISSLNIPLYGTEALDVSGSYAYVGGYDCLHVVDISSPQNPNIVGSAEFEGYGWRNAVAVHVSGSYAYVSFNTEMLYMADVSDPQNPVVVASVDMPFLAKDVYVDDSYAYVACGFSGLQVVHLGLGSDVTIRGTVYDGITHLPPQPLSGAEVIANGDPTLKDETNAAGKYVIRGLPAEGISVTARKDGYRSETQILPYSLGSVTDWHESPYFRWTGKGAAIIDGYDQDVALRLVPESEEVHGGTSFWPIRNGFHFLNRGDSKSPGGYCLGMSLCSFNLWLDDILPNPKAAEVKDYNSAWPLEEDAQVRAIRRLQKQYQHDWDVKAFPGDLVSFAELCTTLDDVGPQVIALSKLNLSFPDIIVRHAVLAYRVVRTPKRIFIWVYDCNHPEEERLVTLSLVYPLGWLMDPYDGYVYSKAVPHKWRTGGYTVVAYSPVSLEVTDPDGYILTESLNEIDGGYYRKFDFNGDGEDDEVVTIIGPKEGEYLVWVVPKAGEQPTATYTLEEYKFGVKTVLSQDVQLQDIPTNPYQSVVMIQATVDMEPDVLNVQAHGNYVTGYVELPAGYSLSEIMEISLSGIVAESKPREVGDYDLDDIPDLMVKFDRQYLIDAIEQIESIETLELAIVGYLSDGTRFEGTDIIRVIDQ